MTAEQVYEDSLEESGMMSKRIAIKAMIEFAKYHVIQAIDAITENAQTETEWESDRNGNSYRYEIIDKHSIITAYPLSNIK